MGHSLQIKFSGRAIYVQVFCNKDRGERHYQILVISLPKYLFNPPIGVSQYKPAILEHVQKYLVVNYIILIYSCNNFTSQLLVQDGFSTM